MKRILFLSTVTIAAATALTAGVAAVAAHTHARSPRATPLPPAASLSARVTNQWFPLKPGTRYVYVGVARRRTTSK